MSVVRDGIPLRLIVGLAGTELTREETELFTATNPLGFILFARNCETRDQIRLLVDSLKRITGRADTPILIDQEGGKVQRLLPPNWRAAPPSRAFGELARKNESAAVTAAWLNARLIAADLAELGINYNCAPVLDVPTEDADPIIGDRAFASEAECVALLGQAACSGFLAGGITPIIKHIPGHGRATADSHVALPVVSADRASLIASDIAPFAALNRMPWAMTAHVVYTAFDRDRPATTSPTVIDEVIRQLIGFEGVLISDDVCMSALSGPPRERADAALAAGCDLVLHCNGDIAEMGDVVKACGPLLPTQHARLAA
ncbi:MAG: beta-N-acetylhexosaminidase, partial [Rhodospirillales bacterium]|nr:beta-N-acetylhexosaminidase [Rhodospirillales bacterium]